VAESHPFSTLHLAVLVSTLGGVWYSERALHDKQHHLGNCLALQSENRLKLDSREHEPMAVFGMGEAHLFNPVADDFKTALARFTWDGLPWNASWSFGL
jgi:hypothetical protein